MATFSNPPTYLNKNKVDDFKGIELINICNMISHKKLGVKVGSLEADACPT